MSRALSMPRRFPFQLLFRTHKWNALEINETEFIDDFEYLTTLLCVRRKMWYKILDVVSGLKIRFGFEVELLKLFSEIPDDNFLFCLNRFCFSSQNLWFSRRNFCHSSSVNRNCLFLSFSLAQAQFFCA